MSDQPSFVKISAVKEYVKGVRNDKDMRTGGDAIDALNAAVKNLLDNAADRAEANKRGTVRGQDI